MKEPPTHLEVTVIVQEQVQCLNVPVNDTLAVDVLHGQQKLNAILPQNMLIQARTISQVEEGPSSRQLHQDMKGVVLNEGLVMLDNVWVIQLGQYPCLHRAEHGVARATVTRVRALLH